MYAVPITGQCMWKRGKSLCTPRGYSYDTGMTHSIFIYFSVFVYLNLYPKKKHIVPVQVEFILVFIPNEIVVQV